MEAVLLLGFTVSLYSIIGMLSRKAFRAWCWHVFSPDRELADAIAILLAVFWPIGWPLIVVVGLYAAGHIFARWLVKNLLVIGKSFMVVVSRFKKAQQ